MYDPNNRDEMHPEDRRNFMIFAVLVVAVWFAYDHFILQPKLNDLATAKKQAEVTAEALAQKDGDLATAAPRPREEILAENSAARLDVKNDALQGSLSLTGGRIDDIKLRGYFQTLAHKNNVVLFSPAGSESPEYAEWGWVTKDKDIKTPSPQSRWRVMDGDLAAGLTPGNPITLFWDNGQGLRFERTMSLDDKYLVTITQRVINNSDKSVTLHPYALVTRHGVPENLYGSGVIHEGPIGYVDGELIERSYKKSRKEPFETFAGPTGWIGITSHYWHAGIFPPQGEQSTYRFIYAAPTENQKERFQTDVTGAARTIAPGASSESTSHLFAGAKKLETIEKYGKALDIGHLDLLLDFGMLYFLTKPLFYVLEFFGKLTGNMGIAIIFLTIMVRLAVFPLANKSFRSFARLKEIAPQMQELREKYTGDKERLQAELVKLYETEKVNPAAGCFPILIQIPIFFALYKTLQIAIEMRQAPFFGWVHDLSVQDPTDLFNLFGLIPWEPFGFLPQIGVWPCLMLLFMLIQRQMNPPPQDKTQAMMFAMMPFIMVLIMSKFAAGLVIYWTFSNALSILQQYIIMRSMGVPVHFFNRPKAEKDMAKEVAEGPAVHPELGVLEDDIEEALHLKKDEETKDISKPKPKKKKKK